MNDAQPWYDQIKPGIRKIRTTNPEFEWLDVDLDQAESQLEDCIDSPEVRNAMTEKFRECGRMRFKNGILFRIEYPEKLLNAENDFRIALLIEKNRLVVTRQGNDSVIEQSIKEIVAHQQATTPLTATCEVVDDVLDLLRQPIAVITDELTSIEGNELNDRKANTEEDLAIQRQKLLMIERHLDPLQTLLRRTLVDIASSANESEIRALRELSDRANWFDQRLHHQLDRVKLCMDQLHISAMDDLSTSMYRLSIIATIFLPLTFITGLLGINVGGIPGAEDKSAFWLVCILLVGLAVLTFVGISRALKR